MQEVQEERGKTMKKYEEILEESGVFEYGSVETKQIKFWKEVRDMCQTNTCRKYDTSWVCPPALGTVEECAQRVREYKTMLVFSVKYDLEDSFDFEGMMEGMVRFKEVCRRIDTAVGEEESRYLILSNEGCDLCETCTYPNAPCRFPKRAHGSLEGYGVMVNQLASQAGIHYINGANTVTYFGALLL